MTGQSCVPQEFPHWEGKACFHPPCAHGVMGKGSVLHLLLPERALEVSKHQLPRPGTHLLECLDASAVSAVTRGQRAAPVIMQWPEGLPGRGSTGHLIWWVGGERVPAGQAPKVTQESWEHVPRASAALPTPWATSWLTATASAGGLGSRMRMERAADRG